MLGVAGLGEGREEKAQKGQKGKEASGSLALSSRRFDYRRASTFPDELLEIPTYQAIDLIRSQTPTDVPEPNSALSWTTLDTLWSYPTLNSFDLRALKIPSCPSWKAITVRSRPAGPAPSATSQPLSQDREQSQIAGPNRVVYIAGTKQTTFVFSFHSCRA